MANDLKHIKIDRVHVKGDHLEDKEALKHNYFELIPDTIDEYKFYTPLDTLIPTNPPILKDGEDFSFYLETLQGVVWTVTDFKIKDKYASGKWTNNRHPDDDEGTFQAQAGTGPELEEESASSAKA